MNSLSPLKINLLRSVFAGFIAALSITLAHAETPVTIVGWEMNGLTAYGTSPFPPSTKDTNVTSSGLTRGAGFTTSGSAAGHAWGGNGLNETTFADAVTGSDFASFTVAPTADQKVSISSIAAYNVRRSGTGPTTGQWQYSIDGTNFTNIGSAITWGGTTTAAGNSQSAISLSGISALQNVTHPAQITLRVVLWGASSTGGTWYIKDFETGDDFIVLGTVEAAGDDETPPQLVSLSPQNGATDVAVGTTLSLNFDEPIKAGNGNVILRQDQTVVETFLASSGNFDGSTVTFTPAAPLDSNTPYFVIVEATAIQDLADNPFPGLLNPTDWTFATAPLDETPPSPTLFPLDDSAAFVATASPTLTYDEPVVLGSGLIEIFDGAHALIESFDVETSPRVTLVGNALRIDPTDSLDVDSDYYIVVPLGVVVDLAGNLSQPIAGPDGWNFTTRGIPAVVISQYYEGVSSNRYIELHNTTGSVLSLDGFQIAAFSPSDTAGNQGWKNGESSTRVTDLTGESIPANGYFLIAEPAAAVPLYALPDIRPTFPSVIGFSGTASIVLYQAADFAIEDVIDAVSITTNQGTDISFYRENNLPGFDFNSGSSILDHTGSGKPWGTKTVAEVNSAGFLDPWLLRGTVDLEQLTLSLSETSVSDNTTDPVVATVTRSNGVGELVVTVVADRPDFAGFVGSASITFVDGETSGQVEILPVDKPFIWGERTVTLTVNSVEFVFPASASLTILDSGDEVMIPIVINEIDSDTPGTDVEEFIELYNNSSETVSLEGVVVVLYNGESGTGEASYAAFDLTGFTIAGNGFFVLGNAAIESRQVTFNNNFLQNGPDAVALYYAVQGSQFPTGTLASAAPGILVDAIVYGRAGDADATTLLAALTPDGSQVIEGSTATAPFASISRIPDGGDRFDSSRWVAQSPTPGITNIIPDPPADDFAAWIAGFDVGGLTGPNDNPSGDGIPNLLKHILGLAPDVANSGAVVEASEAGAGTFTFVHKLAKEIAVNVEYGYEWSTDLATWTADGGSAGGVTVSFSAPAILDGTDPIFNVVEVEATVTAGSATKLFVRITGNLVVAVE